MKTSKTRYCIPIELNGISVIADMIRFIVLVSYKTTNNERIEQESVRILGKCDTLNHYIVADNLFSFKKYFIKIAKLYIIFFCISLVSIIYIYVKYSHCGQTFSLKPQIISIFGEKNI